SDAISCDPGGQLHHVGRELSIGEQPIGLAYASPAEVATETRRNFILNDPACAAKFAQAVEIPDEGHIRIRWIFLVTPAPKSAVCLLGSRKKGEICSQQHNFRA